MWEDIYANRELPQRENVQREEERDLDFVTSRAIFLQKPDPPDDEPCARTAGVVTSASTNPQFTLPQLGAHFEYGETAAYQFVFGEWNLEAQDPKDKVLAPKNLVQYFFGLEEVLKPPRDGYSTWPGVQHVPDHSGADERSKRTAPMRPA
ncbi:hypothetical protein PG991_009388 [Apiospora marii]|uniref:Uncharacterized protein n=1 Tax=Apiospora marii TaxID=335849 RepID=A0ABR1RKG0_9PEZI